MTKVKCVLYLSFRNRSPECRQIGVHGLLTVVRSFKVLGDVSLSQCSQPFSLSQVFI